MRDSSPLVSDRRTFLGHVTAGALALAAAPMIASPLGALELESDPREIARALRLAPGPWDERWLTRLTGKHRQFFDAVTYNDGWAFAFAMNFLNLYNQVENIPDAKLNAVVGLRHMSAPLALNDAMWSKYKLGEFLKIEDPSTRAPAVRNIYAEEGRAAVPGAAQATLAKRGVGFTMCNVALTVLSEMAGKGVGVAPDAAAKEWGANLLPGVTLVPVGVMAVNKGQEKGCTYCFAG
jgi:intracellular sulfur oxidation DsrE/DsrF family protein